jgi:hypothetical protein
MKKYLVILFAAFSFVAFSQAKEEKLDKIITRDYEIIECFVSKISNTSIEYSLKGEKLINIIETNKVAKIEFANGRTQDFKLEDNPANSTQKSTENEENNTNTEVLTLSIKKNTIAVLPIPFVNTETLASSSEMAKFAQNDVYSKLIDKSANIFPLTVQDLRVTNSLLKKAGIDYSNIDEVMIEDLQNILGVDHIVAAKVSYVMTLTQTNTGYGNTTINKKTDTKAKVDDFNISNSSQNKKFDYTVYFDIYKERTKIYTESRQPFFNMKDSWMDSMQYLLKRCPIYKKQ